MLIIEIDAYGMGCKVNESIIVPETIPIFGIVLMSLFCQALSWEKIIEKKITFNKKMFFKFNINLIF